MKEIEKAIKKTLNEKRAQIAELPKGVDWINPLMNFARECLINYKRDLEERAKFREIVSGK